MPAEAARPSGLKATPSTPCLWPHRVREASECADFPDLHRLVVAGRRELLAVGAEGDVGDAASCGQYSVCTSRPSSTSQTLIVVSSAEEAIRRPSGLKATPQAGAEWPASDVPHLARCGVPDPDGPVAAGGGQQEAVGAVGDLFDGAAVAAERFFLLAGGQVPAMHHPVQAARRHGPPVGAEDHARRPARGRRKPARAASRPAVATDALHRPARPAYRRRPGPARSPPQGSCRRG